MTSTIDSTGATFDTFEQIKSDLLDRFKVAFGTNTKTDDQSAFGIIATICAEAISTANELAQEVLSARNPQAAQGIHLDNLASFNGLSRRVPTYSTVAITCTANAGGCTIPAGAQVRDPNNTTVVFEVDTETVIAPSEQATISATAVEIGAVSAAAETLTEIVNPVYGWASVTNAAAASAGYAVQTDTEIRGLRKFVSRMTGRHSLPAIYRALASIDEIGKFAVFANRTLQTDSYGQIAKSVWAICQGGSDSDIAAVLFENVSAGDRFHGSTEVSYTDPDTGLSETVCFDRVSEVPIQVFIVTKKVRGIYPSDGDSQIADAIVAYYAGEFVATDGETDNGFSIGENVSIYRHLTPINSVGGHNVESLQIGKVGGSLSTSDIQISRTELATVTTENITVSSHY